jgi:hypothetical protein
MHAAHGGSNVPAFENLYVCSVQDDGGESADVPLELEVRDAAALCSLCGQRQLLGKGETRGAHIPLSLPLPWRGFGILIVIVCR